MNWKLGYIAPGEAAETIQTAAEWGIQLDRRSLVSQDADVLTFQAAIASLETAPEFEFDGTIKLYRVDDDDVSTTWFVGRIRKLPGRESSRSARQDYEVHGPWSWLNDLIYQQTWKILDPPGNSNGTFTDDYSSHLYLGQQIVAVTPPAVGFVGERIGVRAQMEGALNWVLDQAAALTPAVVPFQFDISALDNPIVPLDEVRDITCAEVVRKQLRWLPDAVTWFDYTTTPPTLHIKRRADLTAVEVTLEADNAEAAGITPRYDILFEVVAFTYEVTTDNSRTPVFDVYPPAATGREFRALRATFDFRGPTVISDEVEIEVETLPTLALAPGGSYLCPQWLKDKIPWINEDGLISHGRTVDITVETPIPTYSLPRELTSGRFPDWLAERGYTAERQTLKFWISYTEQDSSGEVVEKRRRKQVNVSIIATDIPAGSYSQVTSSDSGDYIPVDLAEQVHGAVSVLQYEGQLELRAEECDGAVGIGNKLNLAGGQSAWETMNATVQSIDEDLHAGRTSVSFGPPEHLGPSDLIELLRISRPRVIYNAPQSQASGIAGGVLSGLDGDRPDANTDQAKGFKERQVLRTEAGAPGQLQKRVIDIDTNQGKVDMRRLDNGANTRLISHNVQDGQVVVHDYNTQAQQATNVNASQCNWALSHPAEAGFSMDAKAGTFALAYSDGRPGSVNIAIAACQGRPVALRELDYCEADGTVKKIIVLCSEPYTP